MMSLSTTIQPIHPVLTAVILSDLVMNGFMEILDPISDGACLIE